MRFKWVGLYSMFKEVAWYTVSTKKKKKVTMIIFTKCSVGIVMSYSIYVNNKGTDEKTSFFHIV